ncbi:hypothetical protein EVG20_g6988 [Dentipellis fragilis]|uniref:Uncharacterized protein n=1 Tax=Dentipellis fragilis TaxID=205917 RepID=A0A4Y9YJI8_9AGAM|nr:hypothetical protein EVG20_g6988 [Dentipellis fragilis]
MSSIEQFLTQPSVVSRTHLALEECVIDRSPSDLLQSCASSEFLRGNFVVFDDGEDSTTLALRSRDNSPPEEAILEVPGVLLAHNLPPITDRTQLPRDRVHFAEQSVTVTGLGYDAFERAIHAIRNIHTLFSTRHRDLQLWHPERRLQHPCLTFRTRYVTSKKIADPSVQIPFPSSIDPKGILASTFQGRGVRLEDNDVQFFCAKKGARRGGHSFQTIRPGIFRVGQVVHLQVAFCVVPSTKGACHYLVPKLRSIALMDSSVHDDFLFSSAWTGAAASPKVPKVVSLKRRVGYGGREEGSGEGSGESSSKRARKESGSKMDYRDSQEDGQSPFSPASNPPPSPSEYGGVA